MSHQLPELPDKRALPVIGSGIAGHGKGYTADQMRAYAELAIASVKREPLRDCHTCSLPMSKNPHPDAGLPSKVLEVNVQNVCIPCLTLSRHQWAERASKSENDARRWRKLCVLLDAAAEENGEFPSAIHEAFQMGGEATCEAIDAAPVTATTASKGDGE